MVTGMGREGAEGAEPSVLHIFDPRLRDTVDGGKSERELPRELWQQVRVQRGAVVRGEGGDPPKRCDAPDAHDVGLHDLRGARAEEVIEAIDRVDVLAEGDRDIDASREFDVAGEVVGAQRLFDPRRIDGRQHLHRTRGAIEVPPLVRVDHERAVGAEHGAHGRHPLEVFGDIRLADFDLHRAEPGIRPSVALGPRARRACSAG